MKLGKLTSLDAALIALAIISVIMVGVSYSRQKKAENQVATLMYGIQSANDLTKLKSDVSGFGAYSGSAPSADAAQSMGSFTTAGTTYQCYVAEHGDDAGRTWCEEDRGSWWEFWNW